MDVKAREALHIFGFMGLAALQHLGLHWRNLRSWPRLKQVPRPARRWATSTCRAPSKGSLMLPSQRFQPVPLSSLTAAPSLPQFKRVSLPQDRALPLLTDLRFAPLVVASHRDGLDETLHVMMRAGVRMAFVSGVDGQLAGMVTAEVIMGERPVRLAMTAKVHHKELTLSDVMTPLTQWEVTDMQHIRTSRVGDIVATMREHGLRYLMVTEVVEGQTMLRGLFSAKRLEAALGQPIEADLHAHTFAELEAVLAH
jgi:hypothetical protein